jgi:hypothetical protein
MIVIGLDPVSHRVLANGEFHQYNWYVPPLNSLNILVHLVAVQPRPRRRPFITHGRTGLSHQSERGASQPELPPPMQL